MIKNDDVGGDNDGDDGGVGGADQIGEVQATPSSSTAAASQHSTLKCLVLCKNHCPTPDDDDDDRDGDVDDDDDGVV